MRNDNSFHYDNVDISGISDTDGGRWIRMQSPPWCCYDGFTVHGKFRKTCVKIDRIIERNNNSLTGVTIHHTTCMGCNMCNGYNPGLVMDWVCMTSAMQR